MTQNQCCEKCKKRDPMADGWPYYCSNPSCPCHTAVEEPKVYFQGGSSILIKSDLEWEAPKQDWRERFDKLFPTLSVSTKNVEGLGYDLIHRTKEVVAFIASVRQEGVEEGINRGAKEGSKLGMVAGSAAVIAELLAELPKPIDPNEDPGHSFIYAGGYNDALAATRALLEAKAKEV